MKQEQYNFVTFKRDINLPAFAAMFDYEIDRKKTTKTSIAMKSSNDKVIITKKGGIWVYFSVFDDQDSGTIVDFVSNRSTKSIPEIGRLLADWSGLEAPLPVYDVEAPVFDPTRVQLIFDRCRTIQNHEYLESRGLGSDLLSSDRFAGRIFTDRYDNAVFPHFRNRQVCGLELKNRERGILVKGSQKTFWRSNAKKSDNTLVLTEAVVDALSYQQLFRLDDAMYLATGGGVSASQCQLLADLLGSTSNIEKVLIATDADGGGDRIAERLIKAIDASEFSGEVLRHRPEKQGDDWNDVLIKNPKSERVSFPLPRKSSRPKFGTTLSPMANVHFSRTV